MVAGQDRRAVGGDVLDALHPRAEQEPQPRAEEHVLQQPVEQRVLPSRAQRAPSGRMAACAGQPTDPRPTRQRPVGCRPRRRAAVCTAVAATCAASTSRSPVPPRPGAEPFRHDGGPVGVLLCHGFTGSRRPLRPWAEHLAPPGYGAAAAAARPRHRLAGHEPHPLAGLVRRASSAALEPARPVRPRLRHGAVDGRHARPCAWPTSRRRRRRHRRWSTRRCTRANKALRALPVLRPSCRRSPASATTSRSRAGRGRLRRCRCRPLHSMTELWAASRRPARGHPAAALLPRVEDHVVEPEQLRRDRARGRLDATSRSSAARQLPRGHPRQRRPDDLRAEPRLRAADALQATRPRGSPREQEEDLRARRGRDHLPRRRRDAGRPAVDRRRVRRDRRQHRPARYRPAGHGGVHRALAVGVERTTIRSNRLTHQPPRPQLTPRNDWPKWADVRLPRPEPVEELAEGPDEGGAAVSALPRPSPRVTRSSAGPGPGPSARRRWRSCCR